MDREEVMAQSKPDMANYLLRIAEIEAAIFPTATIATNPQSAALNVPYMLHLAGSVSVAQVGGNQKLMVYGIRVLIVRGTPGASGDFTIEATIQSDMVELAWDFMMMDDYRNLKSVTYTTIQAGFQMDSVQVLNQARFQGTTMTGEVIGSINTIQFGHYMFNTPSGQS